MNHVRQLLNRADTGRFGYKMLEKMGWNEGSGLGAKGTGITKHVAVSKKNNALGSCRWRCANFVLVLKPMGAGVGANADYDYEWLKTQDMYNSVLHDLNVASSDTASESTRCSP